MPSNAYLDMADCSEFRVTLAARPPLLVHATAVLLILLISGVTAWAVLVKANLVVQAPGRVRPIEVPTRVFTSATATLVGRVVEAPFQEGDTVRKGDLLVRMDTTLLDNQIASHERTLQSLEEELTGIVNLECLLSQQLQMAEQKALAELAQAEAAITQTDSRRTSEIRRMEAELSALEDIVQRNRRLSSTGAVVGQQIIQAEADWRQSQEKLIQAKLPVDKSAITVAQRSLMLVNSEFAVRHAELEARKIVKLAEAEAERKVVKNLRIQRDEAALRSPVDGVVMDGLVRPGDVLGPGKAVLEITESKSFQFEARVASKDAGNLQVGMPVKIKFDAYDYQNYGVLEGTIAFVSPDSKVGDLNPSESGNQLTSSRSQAIYVVRVNLHSDQFGRGQFQGRVKLGLSGMAEIIVLEQSLLRIFLTQIRQSISFS